MWTKSLRSHTKSFQSLPGYIGSRWDGVAPSARARYGGSKKSSYFALFNRDIPRYDFAKRFPSEPPWMEDRLYLRVMSRCLMCNAEMYDDGAKWDYMMCPTCAEPLVLMIVGTLMKRENLLFSLALRVVTFIMARMATPIMPRFPICAYEKARLSVDRG